MAQATPAQLASDEWCLNLHKDGGRRVMYGGDPYEDDLEPVYPVSAAGVEADPAFTPGFRGDT